VSLLHSFSTVSLITGQTWHWLHYSAFVSGCCSALYLLATAVRKQIGLRSGDKGRTSLTTKSESRFWRKPQRRREGTASWGPVLFVALWCAMMAYAVTRMPKYDTVTEHNVRDLGRLENGDWAMSSDEQGPFAFRPCTADKDGGVDVEGLLTQGVGWVADHAKWEERGTCKSILRADLGFWWRDKNFKPRRIN
jgi:hypothetical protein